MRNLFPLIFPIMEASTLSECKSIFIYGSPTSCEKAKALLENLPQVKRVDPSSTFAEIRLLLQNPLHEMSLIPLLAQSGISGFRLV